MTTLIGALAFTLIQTGFTGQIEEFAAKEEGEIRMKLVKPVNRDTGEQEQAIVTVPKTVPVIFASGANARPFLRPACTVQVTYKGPVKESFPVQATASKVVLTKEKFYAQGTLVGLTESNGRIRFGVRAASGKMLAMATISEETQIWQETANGRQPRDVSALRNGLSVSMDYAGPIMMSMPPQGGAGFIILSR